MGTATLLAYVLTVGAPQAMSAPRMIGSEAGFLSQSKLQEVVDDNDVQSLLSAPIATTASWVFSEGSGEREATPRGPRFTQLMPVTFGNDAFIDISDDFVDISDHSDALLADAGDPEDSTTIIDILDQRERQLVAPADGVTSISTTTLLPHLTEPSKTQGSTRDEVFTLEASTSQNFHNTDSDDKFLPKPLTDEASFVSRLLSGCDPTTTRPFSTTVVDEVHMASRPSYGKVNDGQVKRRMNGYRKNSGVSSRGSSHWKKEFFKKRLHDGGENRVTSPDAQRAGDDARSLQGWNMEPFRSKADLHRKNGEVHRFRMSRKTFGTVTSSRGKLRNGAARGAVNMSTNSYRMRSGLASI